MEKYGVSEEAELEKEAKQGDKPRCPTCNTPLRDSSNTGVLLCPNCGSRPFERGE